MTILAHLRDQHTRTSALLLGEGLDLVQHTLVLLLDTLAVLGIARGGGVEGRTVGALHHLGGSHVATPLGLQGRGDLAQSGALAGSGHGQLQQVVLLQIKMIKDSEIKGIEGLKMRWMNWCQGKTSKYITSMKKIKRAN